MFCSEPSTWHIATPTVPNVPYCVNELMRTHTCDAWEISRYNQEIDDYNREVEAYVDDLKEYLEDANDYVLCMIDRL